MTDAPLYTCAQCGVAVVVLPSGEIIRACQHETAAVLASRTALMRGLSSVNEPGNGLSQGH